MTITKYFNLNVKPDVIFDDKGSFMVTFQQNAPKNFTGNNRRTKNKNISPWKHATAHLFRQF